MCGIVGIAGKLATKDEGVMQRLLILDYFRGPDSTGLASIRGHDGSAEIVKISSHPLDLFAMAKFKTVLNGGTSKLFLGHNRAATRGKVNSFNAHPYQFGHITGCHNGTLEYKSKSDLEEAVGERFDVDSMAIFAGIEKLGIEETMKLMITGRDSQTGAWSLAWYNQEENTFNLLRNKHRPMWFGYNKDNNKLLFASEFKMLDTAVAMGVNPDDWHYETRDKRQVCFFQTEPDVHYRWNMEELKAGTETKKQKPNAKKRPGKEPVTASAASANPFGRQTMGFDIQPAKQTTNTGIGSHSAGGATHQSRNRKEVVHLLGDIGRPLAGYMDRDKFDALAKYGCSYCQADVHFHDPGIMIFERDDMILCRGCSGQEIPDADNAVPPVKIIIPGTAMDNLA
jgi:predicted glutamine amidotransferase